MERKKRVRPRVKDEYRGVFFGGLQSAADARSVQREAKVIRADTERARAKVERVDTKSRLIRSRLEKNGQKRDHEREMERREAEFACEQRREEVAFERAKLTLRCEEEAVLAQQLANDTRQIENTSQRLDVERKQVMLDLAKELIQQGRIIEGVALTNENLMTLLASQHHEEKMERLHIQGSREEGLQKLLIPIPESPAQPKIKSKMEVLLGQIRDTLRTTTNVYREQSKFFREIEDLVQSEELSEDEAEALKQQVHNISQDALGNMGGDGQ